MTRTPLLILTMTAALLAVPPAEAASLRDLFREVSPAVVVVRTVEKKVSPRRGGEVESALGIGSGVLVSADGKILTAAHVVHTADVVAVEFHDGEIVSAQVVGSYPAADVALLQLSGPPPAGVRPVSLGDSDAVETGDEVMVVGAPYGIAHTMSAGHVGGRRSLEDQLGTLDAIEVLQTDAAVNQGNSGGPLFNMQGEVVGIVSYILSKSGGFEGMSFAISANVARRLLLERKARWSGLDGILLDEALARALNVPQPSGLLLQRVADGSFGHRLGLHPGTLLVEREREPFLLGGDVLLAVGGIRIEKSRDTLREIQAYMQGLESGQLVTVEILREGEVLELSAAFD